MIDFQVAYDKLAGLETADDIANLFRDHNIKAVRSDPEACAISVWMAEQTGLIIRTNVSAVRAVDDVNYRSIPDAHKSMTDVMRVFIDRFDFGWYPDLVK